jgi:hypothetical protein
MEMTHQPDDRQPKRDHQDQKNYSSFPPFFSERSAAATGAAVVSPTFVLQRDRNIQPAAAFTRAGQELFALSPGSFFRHARRFRDHPLQFFHLAAKLRFALREFFLFLVERRPGLRRSAAHAESLNLRGHPKEKQERHDPKNNQRQRHG